MKLLNRLFHTEAQDKQPVRFAVVGLGHFAQTAVLPAFANVSGKAKLAALVTGDAKKASKLGRKYSAPVWHYDAYADLIESGAVDAVYIATPNSEHRRYVEGAAHGRVHVLCEKPLAYSIADAKAMVATCRRAKVHLMTAYRLHFESGNLAAVKAVQDGTIGEPKFFSSTHTMQVDPDNVRVDLDLGGGPLEDIGIYCLNAARYLFRDEPTEASAHAVQGNDRRFKEVPEAVAVTLRFPKDRMATFFCGFGQTKISEYRVVGTEGLLTMNPAFTWNGDIVQTITRGDKSKTMTFKLRDQVAAEITYFSECIRQNKKPEPSGVEGLLDVRILDAIRRSYTSHRIVKIASLSKRRRPHSGQAIKKGPPQKPKPVRAKAPARTT
ncbi:MAG: gfo/Idh/MocA family oxidoreductase [Pirellula sp.]|nr:gfo/Idh/MocA family oxidoreductase [Pirellula sp.]